MTPAPDAILAAPTMQQPHSVLSPVQIESFARDGYLRLDAITTPDEVQSVRAVYDRLFAERRGREVGDQFDLGGTDEDDRPAALPQILHPSTYAPELADTLIRAGAEAIARALLGPEAAFIEDHAILKPAGHGAETPWHQDEAYWDPAFDYASLSVWVPLQEATVENGCMAFVPRSHRNEVLPHHPIGHDPRVHGLEVDAADVRAAVYCPIPAGGATVHHCRTLHYAGPNPTAAPRRAYIMTFGVPPRPRSTPRRFPWREHRQTARDQRAKAAGG